MNQRRLNRIIKIYGKNPATMTQILFYEIGKNDINELYSVCKKQGILNEFSIALLLNALFDSSYYKDIEKFNKHINYRVIDSSLFDDETYLSSDDVADSYLEKMGISSTIKESKSNLRRIIYSSIIDNSEVILERLFKAMISNNNIEGLAQLEDLIELKHKEKKKVLTKNEK